jgi:5'(3')-deoxyribonucleotidase
MRSKELNHKQPRRAPIVYVDMDGVLADFFGAVAAAHHVSYWRDIHRQDLAIDQVARQPGFFASLRPLPNAGKLIRGVIELAGRYSILSSPLLSDVDQSSEEKSDWLKHHLKDYQPQAIIFDHEKYKFAKQADGTPNILIDDYETNIRLWEANGGIGILYKDDRFYRALRKLNLALHGRVKPTLPDLAILGSGEQLRKTLKSRHLYTSREVLKYVQSIHHDYHLEKPIMAHRTWILKDMPLHDLKTPEFVHQDDPYRRVIDIDWDHVGEISMHDVLSKPIVVDDHSWVLDGNHRVAAAKAANLDSIPALIPYEKSKK